ncbi:MAG TPA: hypothetical protein VGG84_08550 [Gemmatimonadaceae bacterium]
MHRTITRAIRLLGSLLFVVACSKGESSAAAGTGASTAASAPPAQTTTNGDTIVRGTITQVSDTVLSLSTPGGEVRIALTQPVKVYTRNRADLSRVTDNAFVGITSVPQPDGTQRATEIHVFPQELRGLGEGSRPMTAPASGGTPSTMTNGSVSGSRMTNGSARMTNGAARMTNGTSKGAAGGTVTVAYNGGSQTITVPPDVPVTVLEATSAKLEPGANVVVVGTRQADGSLKTSRVMLSGSPPGQSNQ